jgi:AbrB family looped-hinge helix DNA binding protein
MAIVKPSSKYQIVIPRQIREQLGIKPGQPVYIDMVSGGKEARISTMSVLDRYRGTFRGVWEEDPAIMMRRDRDSEWDDV